MHAEHVSRRHVFAGIGTALAAASLSGRAPAAAQIGRGAQEISRGHAAIHQEIAFAADAQRIYRTLTVAEEFDRVVRLSAASRSTMKTAAMSAPARIDVRPGGAFALFGGYITGFNLELVPATRLVQAWRSAAWAPGLYSIARFVLSARGTHTLIVFDHTGFPDDAADHLAQGWHENYWEPLAKVLG